jgi:hypothetical protein
VLLIDTHAYFACVDSGTAVAGSQYWDKYFWDTLLQGTAVPFKYED